MRILVGTLFTLENEFEECCRAIRQQTYRNFEHMVIEGLPNKQAHDTLYRAFEQRADEFGLMIKVDADMVIENRHLFERIAAKFKADPLLDCINIKVHDFFCGRLIWGLNAYRNTVRWTYPDEHLFVDLALDYGTVRRRIKDDLELAPAAVHCKNPGPFQAFHYGAHRGLKCVMPGRRRAQWQVLHWRILADVFRHYLRSGDVRVAYALAGIERALTSRFDESAVSFENPFLKELFEREVAGLTPAELESCFFRKRRQRLALLPYPLDYAIVFGLQRMKARWSGKGFS